MKERLLTGSTLALLLCYACADQSDDLSSAEASAGNAVLLTARLDLLVADPTDPDAIVEMTRIYTELTSFANSGGDGFSFESLVRKAQLPTCVTDDGSQIRYDDCAVSNGTVDGTVTRSGPEIEFDLRIDAVGSGAEGSLSVAMVGAITRTVDRLDGQLVYNTEIQGVDDFPGGLFLRLEADYLDIVLGPEGCPLAGRLLVEQEAPGASTAPREASFGPSCGAVRVLQ